MTDDERTQEQTPPTDPPITERDLPPGPRLNGKTEPVKGDPPRSPTAEPAPSAPKDDLVSVIVDSGILLGTQLLFGVRLGSPGGQPLTAEEAASRFANATLATLEQFAIKDRIRDLVSEWEVDTEEAPVWVPFAFAGASIGITYFTVRSQMPRKKKPEQKPTGDDPTDPKPAAAPPGGGEAQPGT